MGFSGSPLFRQYGWMAGSSDQARVLAVAEHNILCQGRKPIPRTQAPSRIFWTKTDLIKTLYIN
jgi:hypothetical protein